MKQKQQIEKHHWEVAALFHKKIVAGDYKQYIFPLLFFKRICDVYDEEFEKALDESNGDLEYASFAEHHHFLVPDGFHWNDIICANGKMPQNRNEFLNIFKKYTYE